MALSSDPDARACAVCGRVLEAVLNSSTGETVDYQHSLAGSVDEFDHMPVPVLYGEIPDQLRPRCDFCHADWPTHTLVTIPLTMPGSDETVRWDAEWAACEECAELIQTNRWPVLTRRAIASFEARYGKLGYQTATDLRVVMYQLRKNMKDFYRGLESAS